MGVKVTIWLPLLIVGIVAPIATSVGPSKEQLISRALKKKHPTFQPRFILDIGANVGYWTTGIRQVYPNAQVLMLEASPDKNDVLKKVTQELNSVEFKITVLSEKKNETVKFFQGGDTGNSMFQENTRYYERDVPVERSTSRPQ